ncbi:MAG: thioredoxin family protein [Candidatus Aminicenantales bacterium]
MFPFNTKDLVGPLEKEEILRNFPKWQEKAASYFPRPEIIEKLRSINYPLKIEVFLGTWCPDSQEHVSAYFKIMEMADNPLITSSYIGLPRDKESRQPYIKGKNITKVPTFIILINDHEKGRIIEHPVKSLEEDIIKIIEDC